MIRGNDDGIPYMNIVRKLVVKSDHRQHRHAVIVIRGGQVVATGYNHGSIHAEVAALGKIWPNRRKGLKIWSLRIRRDGRVGLAKPCPACESFLRDSGVETVYYSTNDGGIAVMKLRR